MAELFLNHAPQINKTATSQSSGESLFKKALIIENNPEAKINIRKALDYMNINYEEAEEGKRGLIMALSNHYDLIICGVNIPEPNGYKLLEQLKKNREKDGIPFIFINGNEETSQIRLGMNLGADDYLIKPTATEELIISIRNRARKITGTKKTAGQNNDIINLKNQIYYNPVTGLRNENALFSVLTQENKNEENKNDEEQKTEKKMVMLYIKILGLNTIADFISIDSFHKIQKELAERINTGDRKSAELFHLKDDTFFILEVCMEESSTDIIHTKAEIYSKEIIKKVSQPMGSLDFEISLSAAIGINTTGVFETDIFETYKEARIAKNFSSAAGGNSYFFYNRSLQGKFNDISKKYLSKYISSDQKRSLYRRTGDPEILNNFEIKVFFLYPHEMIKKELIYRVISNEYAAYILEDHITALEVLKKYSNSILFINIDSGLSEKEWDSYINEIMYSAETKEVKIGILSFRYDKEKAEKYLMKMMIPCGYITLKPDISECTEIILKALEANEAKGTRKYIRTQCKDRPTVSFSGVFQGRPIKGFIYDISSSGMACGFLPENELFLRKETLLENITLRLHNRLARVSGKVAGVYSDENDARKYVIMFRNLIPEEKEKIHRFIGLSLQENMEKEIDILKGVERNEAPERKSRITKDSSPSRSPLPFG